MGAELSLHGLGDNSRSRANQREWKPLQNIFSSGECLSSYFHRCPGRECALVCVHLAHFPEKFVSIVVVTILSHVLSLWLSWSLPEGSMFTYGKNTLGMRILMSNSQTASIHEEKTSISYSVRQLPGCKLPVH